MGHVSTSIAIYPGVTLTPGHDVSVAPTKGRSRLGLAGDCVAYPESKGPVDIADVIAYRCVYIYI